MRGGLREAGGEPAARPGDGNPPQLNLGDCREKEGRLATAWAPFTEAEVAAKRAAREDRVKFARDRIEALEPRLSRLTIDVPDVARVEGLVVKLDGSEVRQAAWGLPAPVDGGVHVIEASGRVSWRGEIRVEVESDQKTITLQVLDEEEASAPPVASATLEPVPTSSPLRSLLVSLPAESRRTG